MEIIRRCVVKKSALILSCCVVLGCLLIPVRYVLAQGDAAGPLDFSIKLELESTDNRDSAPDGLEESNTDFMVKPRVDAIFEMERAFLDFYYEPTLRFRSDARVDQNDEEFLHDLGINLRHSLTPRLTLKLGENFNVTDDPSIEEGGTTLRRDSSFTMNRVTGAVTYDISRMARIEASAQHRTKSYDESELEYLDEESSAGGFAVYRAISRTVTILGEVRMEDFAYEDTLVGENMLTGGGSLDRGFSSASYGVGLENEFRSNCRASLRAGITQFEYEDDTIDSESSPYFEGLLSLAAVPSTRFTASVTHRLRDSDVFPFASQKYTDVSAGIEVDASEKVTFDVSAVHRLSEYEEDSLPAGRRAQLAAVNEVLTIYGGSINRPSGDETAVIVTAGVTFDISDNTTLKFAQQFEDEDSDVSTSFSRNATRASLVRSF